MSTKRKPSDVQYLALQGGGGKGFAFIGAVEALESLGVLSASVRTPVNLKGISGTSAGAIVGMMLAMGCSSKDLLDLFKSNDEFLKFFDPPDSGFVRAIRPNDWRARKSVRDAWAVRGLTTGKSALSAIQEAISGTGAEMFERIGVSSARMTGFTLLLFTLAFSPPSLYALHLVKKHPYLGPVLRDTTAYATNLIYDRGLFPGFAVRDFLRATVRHYLSRHPNWRRQFPDAADVSFAQFKEITGHDFVVVGTNLSQRRSVYFSAKDTPHFRVVEAVGISSCFPLIFKPIWIDADASDTVLGALRGYWVDGGIMNNIPIHAFDGQQQTDARQTKGALPILNPHVLGLALMPGEPMSTPYDMPNDDDPFATFALDLLETTLWPSGPGQYATQAESDQVIRLFSFSLSLFDFAPTEAAGRNPRRSAFEAVMSHFGQR